MDEKNITMSKVGIANGFGGGPGNTGSLNQTLRFSEKSSSKTSDILRRLSDTKRLSLKIDTPGASSEKPFKVVINEFDFRKSNEAPNFKRIESYIFKVPKSKQSSSQF